MTRFYKILNALFLELLDFQDPYAVAVLLENELVIIDLLSPKYDPTLFYLYIISLHAFLTVKAYLSEMDLFSNWFHELIGGRHPR